MNDYFGPTGYFKWGKASVNKDEISWIEEESMWTYLHKQIHNPKTGRAEKGRIDPMNVFFWEDFRSFSRSQRTLRKLRDHYANVLCHNLHDAKMNSAAKITLYFGLSIPIDKEYFKRLSSQNVDIKLGDDGSISRFREDRPGGLELISLSAPSKIVRLPAPFPGESIVGQEEIVWKYLFKKIHHPITGEVLQGQLLTSDQYLWEEFREKHKIQQDAPSLMMHFLKVILPYLHLTRFETGFKVKLYFALEIPVNEIFLRTLKRIGDVVLDSERRIIKYTDKVIGGLKLDSNDKTIDEQESPDIQQPPPHSSPNSSFTPQEDKEIWEYLYEKIQNPKNKQCQFTRMNWESLEVWRVLAKKWKRSKGDIRNYFRDVLIPKLGTADMDLCMKVPLFFALRLPVDTQFYEKLKKQAIIELDEKRCILVYREKTKRHLSAENENVEVFEVEDNFKEEPERKKFKLGSDVDDPIVL